MINLILSLRMNGFLLINILLNLGPISGLFAFDYYRVSYAMENECIITRRR